MAIDIRNCKLVGKAEVASEVLSHSEQPDHTAMHTNLDLNPYRPAHFDGCSNHKDLRTDFYHPITKKDCESDKTSYIG